MLNRVASVLPSRYWVFIRGQHLQLKDHDGSAQYGFLRGVAVWARSLDTAKERAVRRLLRVLIKEYGARSVATSVLCIDSVYRVPWYSRWFARNTLILLEGDPLCEHGHDDPGLPVRA